jgi:hypothetical protein
VPYRSIIIIQLLVLSTPPSGGKREVHTGFWGGDLREGDHLGDPGVDGRIILKWIFKTWDRHGLD